MREMKIYSRKWIKFRFFPDWIQLILTIWVLHGLIFLLDQVIPETVPCDSFSVLFRRCSISASSSYDRHRCSNMRPNSICLGRQAPFSSWLEFCPSVQINLNQSKRPLFPVLFLGIVASLSLFSLSLKLLIPPVNLLFLPAHCSHTVSILASLHTC